MKPTIAACSERLQSVQLRSLNPRTYDSGSPNYIYKVQFQSFQRPYKNLTANKPVKHKFHVFALQKSQRIGVELPSRPTRSERQMLAPV